MTLENLRSLVIVSEERPRVNLTSLFTKMFAAVNLNPRAVSTSFGCRANLAMCLQVRSHLLLGSTLEVFLNVMAYMLIELSFHK